MKKSMILVIALIVLAVLAGCNADQISGFGKNMEKLGDAGLGSRRSGPMNEATENVKTFVENSEKCFNWPDNIEFDGPKDVSAASVAFVDGTGAKFRETVETTINKLLAAKDSSAGSKDLRAVLNSKYDGITKEAQTEKNVYKIMKRSPNGMASLMVTAVGDDSGHFNPAFARQKLQMMGLGEKAVEALINVLKKDLPMPISTYDDFLIFNLITEKFMDLLNVYRTISSGSGGSGKKIDLTALATFQEDIAKSVGSRDYETVGDRMTFDILYYMIYSLSEVNEKYKASETYAHLDDDHKYDEFFDFILNDADGIVFFDKVLNCLDAISYIYDVKLDIASLVSGLV